MIAAILRWLPLSLAIHSAALAATFLLPHPVALSPLFVDLTLTQAVTPAAGPPASRHVAAPPPRRAGVTPSSRIPPSPPPVAAPAPSPPAPEPLSPPDAPPASVPFTPPVIAGPAPPAAAAEPSPAMPTPPPPASVATGVDTGVSTDTTSVPSGGEPASRPSGGAAGAGDGATATSVGDARGGTSTGGGTAGAGDTLALGIAGGDDAGVYAGYIALLRRRVQEALTYPSAARRRGLSGTVHLDISVEPSGKIADVLVVRSSSHELLDAAALDAVRALRQVPFPPGLRPRAVRVRLPVVFELR